jgi:hypothetical protein
MTDTLQYAEPIVVSSPAECRWYHTFDVPGGDVIRGHWDYRHNVDDFFGGYDLRGKSVIEIGPASGYLTVAMEKRGASVVSVDTPLEEVWEAVPRVDIDVNKWLELRRVAQPELRRSWWYAQSLNNCSAKAVYCGIADLRSVANLLHFDTCLIAGVLQHVRYPVDMLWVASRIADEIIVAERWLPGMEQDKRPIARFVPAIGNDYIDTWWYLSSATVVQALGVFGFEEISRSRFNARLWDMKNKDISKDSYREIDMYNAIFRRRRG